MPLARSRSAQRRASARSGVETTDREFSSSPASRSSMYSWKGMLRALRSSRQQSRPPGPAGVRRSEELVGVLVPLVGVLDGGLVHRLVPVELQDLHVLGVFLVGKAALLPAAVDEGLLLQELLLVEVLLLLRV